MSEEMQPIILMVPCDLELASAVYEIMGSKLEIETEAGWLAIGATRVRCACGGECWWTPDLTVAQRKMPQAVVVCMVCYFEAGCALIKRDGLEGLKRLMEIQSWHTHDIFPETAPRRDNPKG